MANTREPKQPSRRIIATVATSTILYAAPIWAEVLKTATYSRTAHHKQLLHGHGQVNFYLTQMITGHGYFKEYLYMLKHEKNPCCDHCSTASFEDAERAFFICPLYARNRAEAESRAERFLTVDNVINCMLETRGIGMP
ncbi:uncharacterized protein LOC121467313 [Drosophila elegans]|uniref:uncharacterized protein LOC121467313 n=1 Tax=Drosophila elegans TaxID=30023 RepID=UPI001BC86A05|nr:uncharacterized protein LOC121467313 [Drosophila elegans]